MHIDPLPRGNVREFETWLLREIESKYRELKHFEEHRPGEMGTWMLAGALNAYVVVLAEYTDRDPTEIHKVAGNYRNMRALIYEGRSAKKAFQKRYAELMENQEEKS